MIYCQSSVRRSRRADATATPAWYVLLRSCGKQSDSPALAVPQTGSPTDEVLVNWTARDQVVTSRGPARVFEMARLGCRFAAWTRS